MWHYQKNELQEGPVNIDMVKMLIANGEIQHSTKVWQEGMETWQAASKTDLNELLPDLQPTPPPIDSPTVSTIPHNGSVIEGTLIGYNTETEEGMIATAEGRRYKFNRNEWKENTIPKRDMVVNFEITEDKRVIDIYITTNRVVENSTIGLGLLTIPLTLLFGFLGTFISRFLIAQQPIGKVMFPTLIHLFFLPFWPWFLASPIGWFITGSVRLYFTYQNYKMVINPIGDRKY